MQAEAPENDLLVCNGAQRCGNSGCAHAKPHKVTTAGANQPCTEVIECGSNHERRCITTLVGQKTEEEKFARVSLEIWVDEKESERALVVLQKAVRTAISNGCEVLGQAAYKS